MTLAACAGARRTALHRSLLTITMQVAKKMGAYIKKHKLQDPKKGREIVADEKLKPVFGKARLDMFQMTKAISKHLSK
jgi:chromatin remodeling complex protein RSC6